MRNPNIDIEVELTFDSNNKYIVTLNDVKKSVFHDFIDYFEGEAIVRHIKGNKYSLKIHNADLIQTQKKLCPEI
ncbi:MAG: hypothetical protein J1E16_06475 [Muribaculaceae bacterium]|nr:hypothetical protein [Muribaculaceae bacterium]